MQHSQTVVEDLDLFVCFQNHLGGGLYTKEIIAKEIAFSRRPKFLTNKMAKKDRFVDKPISQMVSLLFFYNYPAQKCSNDFITQRNARGIFGRFLCQGCVSVS